MSSVKIVRVADRKGLDDFIQFHYDLYRGNPYDVPNLRSDEENTLGKERNAAFDFCEADYFLAYKGGRLCGRVAAIINRRANERWGRKSVRFGWIDFVDDREVSAALLGAVEQWGRERGMEEIVGPLGFTDMDPEGMLTWGFSPGASTSSARRPRYTTTPTTRSTSRQWADGRRTTTTWSTRCSCQRKCRRSTSR